MEYYKMYKTDLTKILLDLYIDEDEAVDGYNKALKEISTDYPDIRKKLEELRDEEKKHKEELMNLMLNK